MMESHGVSLPHEFCMRGWHYSAANQYQLMDRMEDPSSIARFSPPSGHVKEQQAGMKVFRTARHSRITSRNAA